MYKPSKYLMTIKKIVTEIRNGYSVTDNMQLLYESNLPSVKRVDQMKIYPSNVSANICLKTLEGTF